MWMQRSNNSCSCVTSRVISVCYAYFVSVYICINVFCGPILSPPFILSATAGAWTSDTGLSIDCSYWFSTAGSIPPLCLFPFVSCWISLSFACRCCRSSSCLLVFAYQYHDILISAHSKFLVTKTADFNKWRSSPEHCTTRSSAIAERQRCSLFKLW